MDFTPAVFGGGGTVLSILALTGWYSISFSLYKLGTGTGGRNRNRGQESGIGIGARAKYD